ncbi:MAG TPA: UDP-N-acetylmuramoyl-L-alanine--D-glutamate ligase [Bacteroidales bacterium]|nr:UDP-N-acetylmuramoyl-L-alanine--D-glutamate ligase [Bacteroidales bacterium]
MKKRTVILGAGESGTGSALLAHSKGMEVFVSDSGTIKEKYKDILVSNNIEFEEGRHTAKKILSADVVVKSPGIPDSRDFIIRLKKRKIPVVSEIEFAGQFSNAFNICVTGSNGKTTTTYLIYYILKSAGLNVGLAGNVGKSYAMQVATMQHDYYVIELSSFQLDGMYEFKADIALLLNITADHLDRYNYNINEYIDTKFRICNNHTSKEFLIYWADDPIIGRQIGQRDIPSGLMPFSTEKHEGMAASIINETLTLNIHSKTENIMTIHDLALKGRHNTFNSMAAAIAGKILDIRNETIRQCLSDFQGVEHRLESVLSVHGINFINDSKATNVNSTWYALECMTTQVIWIAGGVDKGNEYKELTGLAMEKVKAIVCLGKDNSKIIESFRDVVPTIIQTTSMGEAVKSAYYLASKGDSVLLSPACASFDLFNNYEDRGRQFKEEVRNL